MEHFTKNMPSDIRYINEQQMRRAANLDYKPYKIKPLK